MRKLLIFCLLMVILAIIAGCSSNVKRAQQLIDVKSYDQAIDLLNEEIKANPKNADAHFLLGMVYLKKDDFSKATGPFDSAIAIDHDIRTKVIDELMKQPNLDPSLAEYVNNIDPNFIKANERFASIYLLEQTWPPKGCQFAGNFPQSKRAPKAIMMEADYYYGKDEAETAKPIYQKLVADYADSSEAKRAKELLADWWVVRILELPVNNEWRPVRINRGQRYRYRVTGTTVVRTVFGEQTVDGDDLKMLIGTRRDLMLTIKPSADPDFAREIKSPDAYENPGPTLIRADKLYREVMRCKNRGEGVATRDGYLWMCVDAGPMVYENNFVTVQIKLKE